jgi:HAE1 family hydrophobic/amphiphilic exporter-1
MSFAYSSLSYQEKIAPPAGPTFAAAIVFVFLLLAAMYESWRLPWAVLLGSPAVALRAFFGVWLSGYDNNVYVQIGNIMLIGLGRQERHPHRGVRQGQNRGGHEHRGGGALESARLRFPAHLDDGFRFILGVGAAHAREAGRGRAPRT